MRRLSAHYVLPGDGRILKYGILEISPEGVILGVKDTGGILQESRGLEFYNGVLLPGFINAHCHLELSHLKGKIGTGRGLVSFVETVMGFRSAVCPVSVMEEEDRKMWSEGIVAVGDVSNTDRSFPVKQGSRLYYHTFLEGAGMDPLLSDRVLARLKDLHQVLSGYGLTGSLSPHAPYSVSESLMEKFLETALSARLPVSVHHQESAQETALFLNREGDFISFLEKIYPDFKHWRSPGVSSLEFFAPYWLRFPRILLVHNTFSKVDQLIAYPGLKDSAALVLCPQSNLYIEGCLPDVEGFYKAGFRMAIGTDSLSSNDGLSVLSEVKVLQERFPSIPFPVLAEWATRGGAWALGIDSRMGSFQEGFSPGVNLIESMDLHTLRLLPDSRVKRIL